MITGITMRDALISAANALNEQKQAVDALNIFPVPDGDTGSNMSMTISAAGRELARLSDPTVSEAADTAASAMLRGARGNSGVILSLLFRGFSKGLKGKNEADGYDLAHALEAGVKAAYKAVMKPAEGTILTVAREAAVAGIAAADVNRDPVTVWDVIVTEAKASLARTPDLLPVLKKAGVVDAGGQGFCIVIEEMLRVMKGGSVKEGSAGTAGPAKQVSAAGSFETDIKFAYCTEFIVSRENTEKDPLAFRAYLESVGDCVVMVDDDDIVKVHVHTNDPGMILHQAIEFGQFEMVKVENMKIQHANAGWVEEEAPEMENNVPTPVDATEPYSFVAVAAGDGVRQLFSDLGCAQVVSGGQTMNPSTEDLLNAIEATPGKIVYVLPNNKNIILAAEQAIPLSDREIHVVPTKNIPQGVSAMLAFDPDAEVEDNLIAMNHAYDEISTGSITFAARDSEFDGNTIRENQIMAMENGQITIVENELQPALVKVVKNILMKRKKAGQDSSFLTLMYGEAVSEDEAESNEKALKAEIGNDIEITSINGGQPVYYYILSVE